MSEKLLEEAKNVYFWSNSFFLVVLSDRWKSAIIEARRKKEVDTMIILGSASALAALMAAVSAGAITTSTIRKK